MASNGHGPFLLCKRIGHPFFPKNSIRFTSYVSAIIVGLVPLAPIVVFVDEGPPPAAAVELGGMEAEVLVLAAILYLRSINAYTTFVFVISSTEESKRTCALPSSSLDWFHMGYLPADSEGWYASNSSAHLLVIFFVGGRGEGGRNTGRGSIARICSANNLNVDSYYYLVAS